MTKKLEKMPYAQARVEINDNKIQLISYTTLVAEIVDDVLTVYGLYSQTTRKHISAFMQEFASPLNYYIAKQCYTDNIKINIVTGEIFPL